MNEQPRAHWAIIDTHNRPQVLETNSNGELPRVEALHICGPFDDARCAATYLGNKMFDMACEYRKAADAILEDVDGGKYGP